MSATGARPHRGARVNLTCFAGEGQLACPTVRRKTPSGKVGESKEQDFNVLKAGRGVRARRKTSTGVPQDPLGIGVPPAGGSPAPDLNVVQA